MNPTTTIIKVISAIVLMAIIYANLKFIYADGQNERVSDGGVVENMIFYKKFKSDQLSLAT